MNIIKKLNPEILWSVATLFALFMAAVFFRPLLPIDETRYMTVAWEMRLHDSWLSPLTMNFEPYSHKPPMLFWLINLSWDIFGISRWSGLIPIILSSLSVVFLTVRLGQKLLPAHTFNPLKITLLFLGSLPFIIYNTLVLFDLTLTAFVLCSFLAFLTYAEKRQFRYIAFMGLLMGLGVLTKGPVAYLYVLFPVVLAPLWVLNFTRPASWYRDSLAALAISLFPVCLWLFPVLLQSDSHFAFWLLWEQTAGRVTGNFNAAHVRPFYFYLPILPLIFAPWIFFPAFWNGLKTIDRKITAMSFLACWLIPVFISFSLIIGKQPHYLVPLLPGAILFLSMIFTDSSLPILKKTVLILVGVLILGQGIASLTFLRHYDLRPIAEYMQIHKRYSWAFVRNYQGEMGFLAQLQKPVSDIELSGLEEWFLEHPDGKALIRYKNDNDVKHLHQIMSMPYRGKNLGVFERKN